MKRPTAPRTLPSLTLAFAVVATLGGCADGTGDQDRGAEDFTGQSVRVIAPMAVGGGFDTTIRQLQPALEEHLDARLTVENMEGGATAIGSQAAATAAGDCLSLLITGVPHLQFSYLTQRDTEYDLDAFAPVGGISVEPGVIRVRDDAPWETAEEFFADARERPGEIRMSVSDRTSNNFAGLLDIEGGSRAEFNVVPYDGGGPARNALIAGEVDATHAGAFNSMGISDRTRVLAVQSAENQWPDETDGAPTVSEALGADVPENSSNYTLWAPRGCAEDFPARYQALVDALPEALESPSYQRALQELGERNKVAYLSPAELRELAESTEDHIESLIAENPDVFGQ